MLNLHIPFKPIVSNSCFLNLTNKIVTIINNKLNKHLIILILSYIRLLFLYKIPNKAYIIIIITNNNIATFHLFYHTFLNYHYIPYLI